MRPIDRAGHAEERQRFLEQQRQLEQARQQERAQQEQQRQLEQLRQQAERARQQAEAAERAAKAARAALENHRGPGKLAAKKQLQQMAEVAEKLRKEAVRAERALMRAAKAEAGLGRVARPERPHLDSPVVVDLKAHDRPSWDQRLTSVPTRDAGLTHEPEVEQRNVRVRGESPELSETMAPRAPWTVAAPGVPAPFAVDRHFQAIAERVGQIDPGLGMAASTLGRLKSASVKVKSVLQDHRDSGGIGLLARSRLRAMSDEVSGMETGFKGIGHVLGERVVQEPVDERRGLIGQLKERVARLRDRVIHASDLLPQGPGWVSFGPAAQALASMPPELDAAEHHLELAAMRTEVLEGLSRTQDAGYSLPPSGETPNFWFGPGVKMIDEKLAPSKEQMHAQRELAKTFMSQRSSDSLALSGEEFVGLVHQAGINPETVGIHQLEAALHYVNQSQDPNQQQTRLRRSINCLQALTTGKMPQLTPEETSQLSPEKSGLSGPPLTEQDAGRIGTRLGENPPQGFWNEGLLCFGMTPTPEDEAAAHKLAEGALGLTAGADRAGSPVEISAADLACMIRDSGIELETIDPKQLVAATNYINTGKSGAIAEFGGGPPKTLDEQCHRLKLCIKQFRCLDRGAPALDRQQVIDSLWSAAKVPGHALEKLSDTELREVAQQVATAVNTPGEHTLKIGKHKLTLNIGEDHAVGSTTTKKVTFLSKLWSGIKKVGGFVLKVGSFIPGPIGAGCRIVNGVIAGINAIKNKNLLGGIAGIAGAIGGGAVGLLGKGAAGVARIANGVAGIARGIEGIQKGGVSGILGGVAGVVGGAAGVIGTGANKLANTLTNMSKRLGQAGKVAGAAESYIAANKAVKEARQAVAEARKSGDPVAIQQAEEQLARAESSRRSSVFGGLATVATTAGDVVKGKNAGLGKAFEKAASAASTTSTVWNAIDQKDWLGAVGAASSFGSKLVDDKDTKTVFEVINDTATTAAGVKAAIDRDDLFSAAELLMGYGGRRAPGKDREAFKTAAELFHDAGALKAAIETKDWLEVIAVGSSLAGTLSENKDIKDGSVVLRKVDALEDAIQSKDPDKIGEAARDLYETTKTKVKEIKDRHVDERMKKVAARASEALPGAPAPIGLDIASDLAANFSLSLGAGATEEGWPPFSLSLRPDGMPVDDVGRPWPVPGRTYEIQEGDTLSQIAQQAYGDASRWPLLFLHNTDLLGHPNAVPAGIEIEIPPADTPLSEDDRLAIVSMAEGSIPVHEITVTPTGSYSDVDEALLDSLRSDPSYRQEVLDAARLIATETGDAKLKSNLAVLEKHLEGDSKHDGKILETLSETVSWLRTGSDTVYKMFKNKIVDEWKEAQVALSGVELKDKSLELAKRFRKYEGKLRALKTIFTIAGALPQAVSTVEGIYKGIFGKDFKGNELTPWEQLCAAAKVPADVTGFYKTIQVTVGGMKTAADKLGMKGFSQVMKRCRHVLDRLPLAVRKKTEDLLRKVLKEAGKKEIDTVVKILLEKGPSVFKKVATEFGKRTAMKGAVKALGSFLAKALTKALGPLDIAITVTRWEAELMAVAYGQFYTGFVDFRVAQRMGCSKYAKIAALKDIGRRWMDRVLQHGFQDATHLGRGFIEEIKRAMSRTGFGREWDSYWRKKAEKDEALRIAYWAKGTDPYWRGEADRRLCHPDYCQRVIESLTHAASTFVQNLAYGVYATD